MATPPASLNVRIKPEGVTLWVDRNDLLALMGEIEARGGDIEDCRMALMAMNATGTPVNVNVEDAP